MRIVFFHFVSSKDPDLCDGVWGGWKKYSTFNENTRNLEVLSFARNYFMPPLGKKRKLPSQPPSKATSVSAASVCTAEAG